jgi:hypothetical protein
MKRLLAALVLVAASVAGVVGGGGGGASADSPYQTAYWSRIQIDIPGLGPILPVSVPPVTNGGLFVSTGPRAPLGFGALRYYLEGPTGGTLTLTVDTGSAVAAEVLACRITTDWASGDNQSFVDAPGYDCTDAIVGTPDTTGMTVTWELTPAYFRPTVFGLDVAIVPGGTAPVQLLFAAPGPDSFVHPPVTPAATPGIDTPPETLPPLDLLPGLTPIPLPGPVGGIDLPPSVTPTPGPGAPITGAPTPTTPTRPAIAVEAPDDGAERLLAGFGLALLLAGLAWATGFPSRLPWHRMHAPRGIGRFARPREGAPPRL